MYNGKKAPSAKYNNKDNDSSVHFSGFLCQLIKQMVGLKNQTYEGLCHTCFPYICVWLRATDFKFKQANFRYKVEKSIKICK